MTLQAINYGAAANDGTGDSLREAMRKTQQNFEFLGQSKADAQATAQAIAQKADAQATAQALEGKVTAEAGKSLMTDAEHQKLSGIAAGAQVNAPTNLALGAATANAREITSSTGGSVTLPAATSSTAGLMTAAESAKLSTVATNASANSSDAFLLNRGNHSGPLNWAWSTYGGTANAITLTPAFARAAYAAGDQFRFRATATNTGAATINVGGLGVKSAVTVTGAALPAGYIRTDMDTVCVYDGTNFVVQREVEVLSNASGRVYRYADGSSSIKVKAVLALNDSNYQAVPLPALVTVGANNSVAMLFSRNSVTGSDIDWWNSRYQITASIEDAARVLFLYRGPSLATTGGVDAQINSVWY